MSTEDFLAWIAVGTLSISYWFQIWKIHVHKEVRDISLPYHVCLAIGFGILTYTAYIEESVIFMAKQILTTIPVLIIISQIFIHRGDNWHDNTFPECDDCKKEIEPKWNFCPNCGSQSFTKTQQKAS